jgi:alcohol dehydrogenase
LLHEGAFGNLSWVESVPMSEGSKAFADLDSGKIASSKLVLMP